MKLPIVAIVGRPNVGKSSLFNMLAGRRISIVDPTSGVTRDRVSTPVAIEDRYFELVDTGGMGIQDKDNLTDDVEHQIRIAIDEAALVLFMVDVRDGVVPLDEDVGQKLRSLNKPIIFLANKADEEKFDVGANDFYSLGYGEPMCISADQRRGKQELLEAIAAKLPTDSMQDEPKAAEMKIAIVGRRNVGKSTFINNLAEADRVIVSEVAGTTRDSVDVRFERDGKTFIAIDTAGVRKKSNLDSIEFYSMHRAERSIRRADVVLMFFDPRLRISRVDKQLAEYILENHKPAIFVVNKWDLVKDRMPTERWATYLRTIFPMLDYVPIAFVTAKSGKNVFRLLNLAQELFKQSGKRVKTGELNRCIRDAIDANVPPVRQNRVPKIYYVTQVATHPPTVIIVTNGPELFDDTYVRYLKKSLRESFPFAEVPIRLMLKTKGEAASRGEAMRLAAAMDIDPVPSKADLTQEIPALAQEQPVDALDPQRIDEDDEPFDPDAVGSAVPEAPAPVAKPKPIPSSSSDRPFRKKKKPNNGTWDV